jgi:hypothetical protein
VDVEIDQTEIPPVELVVQGMTSFETRAKVAYEAAVEANAGR